MKILINRNLTEKILFRGSEKSCKFLMNLSPVKKGALGEFSNLDKKVMKILIFFDQLHLNQSLGPKLLKTMLFLVFSFAKFYSNQSYAFHHVVIEVTFK